MNILNDTQVIDSVHIESMLEQFSKADLLLIYDLDGYLIDANQTFLDQLSYSREQLLALTVGDVESDWTPQKLNKLSEPLRVGIPIYYDSTYRRRDGSTIPVDIHLSLIEVNNHPCILALARDLTESKVAQARLQNRLREQDSEIARLTRELKAFSYSVSHDLRAPLRAIRGFAHIIARRHWDSLNEESQHFLDLILEAGSHMDQLVLDLLAYSRLSRRTVRYQEVDLTNLLNQVILDLSEPIERNQARINRPAEMPVIKTDPSLMQQIFNHLIENAIRYHRPDLTARVSITCRQEADRIVIGIADNGLGIPAQYHAKVFTMFQQLHHKGVHEGNGIGLSLVKKAVELLSGSIEIESVEGQGTTFWIMLPYPPASPGADPIDGP